MELSDLTVYKSPFKKKRFGRNNRIGGAKRQDGIDQRWDSSDSNQYCLTEPISDKSYGANNSRSLGVPKPSSSFKPPIHNQERSESKEGSLCAQFSNKATNEASAEDPPLGDERLRGIDPKMVELIQNGELIAKKCKQ